MKACCYAKYEQVGRRLDSRYGRAPIWREDLDFETILLSRQWHDPHLVDGRLIALEQDYFTLVFDPDTADQSDFFFWTLMRQLKFKEVAQ